jgi:2'-hydroxyisoflavone reductase
LEDRASENVERDYGALKVQCERVVEEAFPARSLHVRAGLIVGPHDPTGRFTYWVHRISEGGEVLAPAPTDAPVQVIDARDLADWTVRMISERGAGAFNVTGPAARLTLGELLERCVNTIGSDARFTWVDPSFLLEHDVKPWDGLPLWLPDFENEGMMQANVTKALSAGLRFRPVSQTVRDVLDWIRSVEDPPGKAGLARKEERALLAEWQNAS